MSAPSLKCPGNRWLAVLELWFLLGGCGFPLQAVFLPTGWQFGMLLLVGWSIPLQARCLGIGLACVVIWSH